LSEFKDNIMLPVTNAHTHLELSCLDKLRPGNPVEFIPWMRRLVRHQQELSDSQIIDSIGRGITELKACGTTHVGDITYTGLSVTPLLNSGLQGIIYMEIRGRERDKALKSFEQIKTAILKARKEKNDGLMQVGLSLHAPYSCHPDLLRIGSKWCRDENIPLCIHVSESPAETKLIQQLRASYANISMRLFMKFLGIVSLFVPMIRPVPYIASLGVLDSRPLLVHAIHVTDEDIRIIADSGCSVVHCPRSNIMLSCGRMPLERFISAGIRVYLGTDSLASSPSLNVYEEALFAKDLHADKVNLEQVSSLIHQQFP
jgi:cytosine/adenosine deaminase-related metal-dependent hydrolase